MDEGLAGVPHARADLPAAHPRHHEVGDQHVNRPGVRFAEPNRRLRRAPVGDLVLKPCMGDLEEFRLFPQGNADAACDETDENNRRQQRQAGDDQALCPARLKHVDSFLEQGIEFLGGDRPEPEAGRLGALARRAVFRGGAARGFLAGEAPRQSDDRCRYILRAREAALDPDPDPTPEAARLERQVAGACGPGWRAVQKSPEQFLQLRSE